MDPVTIIMIITAIITAAFKLWQAARQVFGALIPDWSTILQDNMNLQAKIDAEKAQAAAQEEKAAEEPAEKA